MLPDFIYNFWFIQGIGAIGLVFVVLAWNAKTRKNILHLQAVNISFFIIHYALLSAFAGAALCVVTLLRNLVFVRKNENNWAGHPTWFYFFSVISALVLAVFWKGWITVLPVAGVILGTYALTRDRPSEIRFYVLLTCFIWIPYTIVVHSYSGLLSQVVGITGLLIGMYRHDWNKKTSILKQP